MVSNVRTRQLSYWEGTFGDEYIKRNSDSDFFGRRKTFFKMILKKCGGISSVLEVGCNIGKNIEVLKDINPSLKYTGLEPNKKAARMAKKSLGNSRVLDKSVFDIDWDNKYDLVFTSGVLIHISDDDLKLAMEKIYKTSKKYILTIEYFSKKQTTIPYRGLPDALFKRPYAKEYTDLFPDLKIVQSGSLDKSQGFDNCNFCLFQKHCLVRRRLDKG